MESSITWRDWEEEQCIETALLPLFSVETLGKLLQWESEKKDATWDEIIKQGFAREKYILGENANLLEIAKICSKKEFFKRVAGGEELGKMFFEKISGISPDSATVKTVNSIVSWINYGEELGLSK